MALTIAAFTCTALLARVALTRHAAPVTAPAPAPA
jgi:hypothetical protein